MRLRKLTKKSIMGFGRYQDLSVQNVLFMNRSYLVWAYYNMSHITFFENILTEIGVHEGIRFDKPGCNKEIYKGVKCTIPEKPKRKTQSYLKRYFSNHLNSRLQSKLLNRNRNQWRSK